jgi:hypothetical protein
VATGAVAVRGLKELQRAFNKMEDDVAGDLVMELQEAADPVRKLTEQYILGEMRGVAQSRDAAYWSAMRIGVAKRQSTVYVAPQWRSNKGTRQGRILAVQERIRMERAVETKSGEIEKRLGDWLDRMADDWGRGA